MFEDFALTSACVLQPSSNAHDLVSILKSQITNTHTHAHTVFEDFALTSARVLRATSDTHDLVSTLRSTLEKADLRRVEALTGDKLRRALVVAMGECL